jgi:hypothetical protein
MQLQILLVLLLLMMTVTQFYFCPCLHWLLMSICDGCILHVTVANFLPPVGSQHSTTQQIRNKSRARIHIRASPGSLCRPLS